VVEVGDELVLLAELGEVLLLALLREEHLVGLELVVRGIERVLGLALARHLLLQLGQFLAPDRQLLVLLGDLLLQAVQRAFELLQLFEFLERDRLALLRLARLLGQRDVLFEQLGFLVLQLLDRGFLLLDGLVERAGAVVGAGQFVAQFDVLHFLLAELGRELGLLVRLDRVLAGAGARAGDLGFLRLGLRLVARVAGDFLVARDLLDQLAFGNLECVFVQVLALEPLERHAELLERVALRGVELESVLVEDCDQGRQLVGGLGQAGAEVDFLVREVVVDTAAERVELRELEHGAGVGGDERADAPDIEQSLERLRRVVDVQRHRLGHLDLAVDALRVVELERLGHVERARLELRHEALLEREHHDHLERVAVPLVAVLVLEPQQVRDLRLAVGLRRRARVLLVEALQRLFVVGDRVRVFVEQQRERLVGALVGAELLRDEVEQVEVLGHVDQLVLHALDQAPVRHLGLRLLLRVLEERLQLGLVDLALEQRAELLLRLELEVREVAHLAGLRLAAAHLLDHVLDALDLLVALVVDRLLEDRALVFERDEVGVERLVLGLQRLVLGGRTVVQLALLDELAVELREFLARRRVLVALVGDLLRDRVDLALHLVHVVLLGFVHDRLLDALADGALVPALERLLAVALLERRVLFSGAALFRLRLHERLLQRREAGAAAGLRVCIGADELVHLVLELLDEFALLLDVFVFLLDVFFHFAQLVFVEVAGVLALFSFELARLLLVERAELVERELHVFHGGLVGVVADLEVGQFLVLDLHHVLEGFEVLRRVARVRLVVELDFAEVFERAQLAAFLLVELHLQRADLLGVLDLDFLDLLAQVRALVLLALELGVLLVDDLLERADGFVGLARLVRELLLDGLFEVEVEAVELAPERGVRVGVLGALDLLLLLEQVR